MEQLRFDPLDFEERMGLTPEAARREALAARNVVIKAKQREGYRTKGWTMTGQLRKYKSFGVECGRIRNVYYLNIYPNDEWLEKTVHLPYVNR